MFILLVGDVFILLVGDVFILLLDCDVFQLIKNHTFLDFIFSGMQINFTVSYVVIIIIIHHHHNAELSQLGHMVYHLRYYGILYIYCMW